MQTKTAAEKLAAPLGEVEKIDVGVKGFSMGKYLRVRLKLDITQPLSRGKTIRMGHSNTGWVDFRQFGPWLRLDLERLQRPMVAEVEKRKTNGGGGGGKSNGKTDALPPRSPKARLKATVRSCSGGSDPQSTDFHMAADLEMENTSPPIFSSVLFSDQLRDIDRAINKFDCPNEEIAEKESHVINS
ncbi:hypothetical protein CFP56_042222 [Quercus suber]|uniref:Uncharacterized protein n=1 Tax=Quercus suber TaxID=58331 RepID=A0AAW0M8H8_QUESU|nr:hypothetical protein CFP56_74810 [Quercus suber]